MAASPHTHKVLIYGSRKISEQIGDGKIMDFPCADPEACVDHLKAEQFGPMKLRAEAAATEVERLTQLLDMPRSRRNRELLERLRAAEAKLAKNDWYQVAEDRTAVLGDMHTRAEKAERLLVVSIVRHLDPLSHFMPHKDAEMDLREYQRRARDFASELRAQMPDAFKEWQP